MAFTYFSADLNEDPQFFLLTLNTVHTIIYLGGDKLGYKDRWNRKKYDSVNIRFPSGTRRKFKALFPGIAFNGFVVNLVVSRLLMADQQFSDPDDSQVTENQENTD